jgi:hypothetical protein
MNINAVEARRILKSFNQSPKWARRVNKMTDETVFAYLDNLAQQKDLRKIA